MRDSRCVNEYLALIAICPRNSTGLHSTLIILSDVHYSSRILHSIPENLRLSPGTAYEVLGATKPSGTGNIVPTDVPIDPRDVAQGPRNGVAPRASSSVSETGKETVVRLTSTNEGHGCYIC